MCLTQFETFLIFSFSALSVLFQVLCIYVIYYICTLLILLFYICLSKEKPYWAYVVLFIIFDTK